MAAAWVWWVLPLVTWLVPWALALVVFATAPRRRTNRLLAVVLVLEGTGFGFAQFLQIVSDDPSVVWTAVVFAVAAIFPLLFVYPLFLASAVDSPLARPFKSAIVSRSFPLLAVAAFVVPLVRPDWFVGDIVAGPIEEVAWYGVTTPVVNVVNVAYILLGVFALVAAVSALRRAPRGGLARRRAAAFVAAFGFRDATFLVAILWLTLVAPGATDVVQVPAERVRVYLFVNAALFWGMFVAYYLLLAYGIVRAQLFDIDVKIKWTLRQSTVAAVFAAVFVGVAAALTDWLGQTAGIVWGGLAAGALVFALAPIQRLAQRVADRAMPRARSLEQLSVEERREIYREQARLAWADGQLSMGERRMLEGLRAQLGLSPDEALGVEAEAAKGAGSRG